MNSTSRYGSMPQVCGLGSDSTSRSQGIGPVVLRSLRPFFLVLACGAFAGTTAVIADAPADVSATPGASATPATPATSAAPAASATPEVSAASSTPTTASPGEPADWPPIKRMGKAELAASLGENQTPTEIQKYDLKEFLAAVLQRDPAIVSAQLDAAADDYAYHSARVSYFPRLTATGRTGYIRGAVISPFVYQNLGGSSSVLNKSVKGYTDYGGGSLVAPIFEDGTFLGINTPPKALIALALKHVADANIVLTRDQIRYRAIDIYIQTVAAYRQQEFYKLEVGALNRLANIAKVKQPYHLVSGADVNIAEAELLQSKALYQQGAWLVQGGLMQAAMVLGINDPSKVQLKLEYPPLIVSPDFDHLLSKSLLSHPTIMAQQAQIDSARAQHKFDQSQVLPKVEGDGEYEFGSDYAPPGQDRWTADILVTLPIFDFGVDYYNIRSSQKEIESQIQKLYSTKQDLVRTIQERFTDVENANVTYLTAQVALDKDEFAFKKYQVLEQSGQAPSGDYMDAQRLYASDAIDAETDHYQLILAYAALEEATSSAWQWSTR